MIVGKGEDVEDMGGSCQGGEGGQRKWRVVGEEEDSTEVRGEPNKCGKKIMVLFP